MAHLIISNRINMSVHWWQMCTLPQHHAEYYRYYY